MSFFNSFKFSKISLISFGFYKLGLHGFDFHFIQIVIESIIDFDILIHFDIIIETAPNLDKTKNFFCCFLIQGAHKTLI